MSVCCVDCFHHDGLRRWVATNGDRSSDTCIYCSGTTGPFVCVGALADMFRRVVLDAYVPFDELSSAHHMEAIDDGEFLSELIDGDHGVFSDGSCDHKEALLFDILNHGLDPKDDGWVRGLWAHHEQDWLHWDYRDYWSCFAGEAKRRGRGLLRRGTAGHRDEDTAVGVIEDALQEVPYLLAAGTVCYRARRGRGYVGAGLGAPPATVTTAGRANFEHQPVLYLSTTAATAVSEVVERPHDEVTVGRFATNGHLRLCDLRSRHESCNPFVEGDAAWAEYKARSGRNKIRRQVGREFSTPIDRTGRGPREDYLPTQVATLLMRRLGFDGLAYGSARDPGGENIVLFDPACARLTAVVPTPIAPR
jgi:hypothetical protein